MTVQLSNETVLWFIIPAQCMLVNERGHFLNFLTKKIDSDSSALASLRAELKDGFTVHFSKHDFIFSAKNGSPIICLMKPLNLFDVHAVVLENDTRKIISDYRDIRKVLLAETHKLLAMKSGKDFYDDIHLNDYEFLLLYNHRYRRERNIIYHYNVTTKLWHELDMRKFNWHLSIFYKEILKRKASSHLQEHVPKKTVMINIRNIILDEGENVYCAGSLNSNFQLFFTNNRTIDTSSIPPITRQIKKFDLAQTTCGWSYDPELSAAYHDSVELYFNKLFPLKCERDWFLSFIARILNGKRDEELFVLLTDEGKGQCGITTLISLLSIVFGKYYVSNTRIVVDEKSQDNHYIHEGMYDLEKKRLLVADRLTKKDTLNCCVIKALTAESNHIIEWDYDNSHIKYALQTGFIMVVTDNNIPKFDKTDKHFRERMVVCPMRSRFVKQNFETVSMSKENINIHIANKSLQHELSVWSSAVLDLLIKYYNTSVPTIPDSMADYKKRVYEYFDRPESHSNESHILSRRFIPSKTEMLDSIIAKMKFEHGYIHRRNHVYISENGERVEAGTVIISKDLDSVEI
ncbi:GfV-C21-ORf1 [Ichnoviriform fumiferanae]|uniref:GfV-C21-ORf1 n=1 Tax=Ichnoviriform fumiferanae TaxID=419435 RepID=A2PZZ0_9VIRU|nr:GfV-C21-ORF1 [Ichnoviriform fumiferanae]BAF45562.1 GfV-C21-ORf1 [Ichnoviriform fumiferanae]